ncbi:Rrf2 family transcriptional regulator [Peptostreptococcaceae bacterium OttesenSCG-928-C18]|nr:Rrf2 family transcriptional regulator [Peptostreptococcaceae bacterium OttesenSCG-928-C18]
MKYTKATNYALHIMAYLVKQAGSDNLSLQPLANHLNMSPSYLSKILTQLVKADLIQSTPGVNGGYSLKKNKEKITFLDVTQAIEGSGSIFTCDSNSDDCQLQRVIREAENRLESYLQEKTIYEVVKDFSEHSNSRYY